ncbi:unnamed protein product [Clonostachys rosea f. rosea IK726]|uniref:Uncharacterized protein n=1 Tax=Clonostachys rosea f. rosea IK726 TaxID=1349383 RepID=A0ACA9UU23_BIOOC|nr:unnamed protein product [Clonostachys rosea f. rosea IK726]
MDLYTELQPNETLCVEFTKAMQELGIKFLYDTNRKDVQTYSTDIASITAAHDAALASTKGIGFAGLSILLDDAITSQVQEGELY